VLADALRLGDDARAELVAERLASLDRPGDTDAQQARETEIGHRIEEIEAGRMDAARTVGRSQTAHRQEPARTVKPVDIAAPASLEFAEAAGERQELLKNWHRAPSLDPLERIPPPE
jgi:hypothetical protein